LLLKRPAGPRGGDHFTNSDFFSIPLSFPKHKKVEVRLAGAGRFCG
jgi:hypothetical protein